MSAAKLYTPQLLAAAVELAAWPPLEGAALHGSSRSPTCGSTLDIDLELDGQGKVEQVGLRVRACAVGQASAAIFARHAAGKSLEELAQLRTRFAAWLQADAAMPDWPDITLIAPAKDYSARHGAMLLPWDAAMAALSSSAPAG